MVITYYVILSIVAIYFMLRLVNVKSAKQENRRFFTPWFSDKDGVHSERLDNFLNSNYKFLWLLSIVGLILYIIINHYTQSIV